MLPRIYSKVKSRLAKKFIHTTMFALLINSEIQQTISDYRENNEVESLPKVV
jgi:hypothetical protein